MERQASAKAIEHFGEKGISTDSLYVWYVDYPDTTYENSYSVVLDLAHKEALDEAERIDKENAKLAEKHKNEEWSPIIIPPTGNISGKERAIYYYSEKDSVVDILSQ